MIEDLMNIICRDTKSTPSWKYPALYRDRRDGEILLMIEPNKGLVVRAANDSSWRSRKVGAVIPAVLGENDELFAGEVVFSNE